MADCLETGHMVAPEQSQAKGNGMAATGQNKLDSFPWSRAVFLEICLIPKQRRLLLGREGYSVIS